MSFSSNGLFYEQNFILKRGLQKVELVQSDIGIECKSTLSLNVFDVTARYVTFTYRYTFAMFTLLHKNVKLH